MWDRLLKKAAKWLVRTVVDKAVEEAGKKLSGEKENAKLN